MLDLSGKGPKHEPVRGKGSLPFFSFILPTPMALAIFLAIAVLLLLLYLFYPSS